MQAYVLITAQVSQVKEALQGLKQIEGVKKVDAVTGPYDIIALVEGENMNVIGEMVVSKIQNVPGVSRTLTCLIVEA
jgi:DNA-binding Lrp family transcriptional regulator